MPDNVENIKIIVDNTQPKQALGETNKELGDIEKKAGEVAASIEKIGDAAVDAQAKVVTFRQISQASIERTAKGAETRAAFAGLTDQQKQVKQFEMDLLKVRGDPGATARIEDAKKSYIENTEKQIAAAKALKDAEAQAARQAKDLAAQEAAAAQIRRETQDIANRAELAGLNAAEKKIVLRRREIEATRGDTAAMLERSAAHSREDVQLTREADRIAKANEEKKVAKELEDQLAQSTARNMSVQAAAERTRRETQEIANRAELAGLDAAEKRVVFRRREIEQTRGDAAATLERAAAHAREDAQLAAADVRLKKANADKEAQAKIEKEIADNVAKRAALERDVAQVMRQAMTPLEKLHADRDALIGRLGNDKKAIEGVTNAFAKWEERIKSAGQSEGLFSRSTALGRTFLGIKDIFEGRTAYGEVELATAATKALGGGAGGGLAALAAPGGALAGVIALYGGLAIASKSAAEKLGELSVRFKDIEERTGLSADQITKFTYAARVVGQDVTIAERLMRGLTQAVEDMSPAGEKARKTLADMGVIARDASGNIKPTAELLTQISTGFANLPEGTARQKDALDLFKRFGQEAIPFISELNDNLKTANELGIPGPTQDQINQWGEYNKLIHQWGMELDHLKLVAEGALGTVFGGFFGVGVIPTEMKQRAEQMQKEGKFSPETIKRLQDAGILPPEGGTFGTRGLTPQQIEQIRRLTQPKPGDVTLPAGREYETQSGLRLSLGPQQITRAIDQSYGNNLEGAQKKLSDLRQALEEARTEAAQIATAPVLHPGVSDAAIKKLHDANAAYERQRVLVENLQRAETLAKESADHLAKAQEQQSATLLEAARINEQRHAILATINSDMDDQTRLYQEFQAATVGVTSAELAEHSEVGKQILAYRERLAILEKTAKSVPALADAINKERSTLAINLRIAAQKDKDKFIEDSQREAEQMDRDMRARGDKEGERAQRFEEETFQLHTENIKALNEADIKAVEEREQARLHALDRADAQTIQAKIELERQKLAIENQATEDALVFRLKAIDAEATAERQRIDDYVQRMKDAGYAINPQAVIDRQREVDERQQRERNAAIVAAQNKMLEMQADAANKMAQIVIEQDRKVFDTFKHEANTILDALFSKSSSFFAAIGNALKAAVLTPFKDIMSNQIAAGLTRLVTGDQVRLQQQYQGSGLIGRFLTSIGLGSVATFQPKSLPVLANNTVPVTVMNQAPVQQQVTVNGGDVSNQINLPQAAAGAISAAGGGGGGISVPAGGTWSFRSMLNSISSGGGGTGGGGWNFSNFLNTVRGAASRSGAAAASVAANTANVFAMGGGQTTTDLSNVFGLQSIADAQALVPPAGLGVNNPQGGGMPGLTGFGLWSQFTRKLSAFNTPAVAGAVAPLAFLGSMMGIRAAMSLANNPGSSPLRGITAGVLGMASGALAAGSLMAMFPVLAAAGPIGLAVGAAIGLGLVLKSAFSSKPREIRDLVRSVYGINITQTSVLNQLAQLADQKFGGSIHMMVYSQEARQLITLYAMSTGQNPKGILDMSVASQFANIQGSLTAMPSYFNGMPVFPGDLTSRVGYASVGGGFSLPSAALGAYSAPAVPNAPGLNYGPQAINLQLDPTSTAALLTGQAVQAIQDNPRLVSVSAISGQDASAGRREATVNILQPNYVVS